MDASSILAAAPALTLVGYGVRFNQRVILSEVNLTLPATGIDVLMGPVKAGKSTLLRSLAGLNDANPLFHAWGATSLAGAPLEGERRPLLVQQRATVLQLDVWEALVSGLRARETRNAKAWRALATEVAQRQQLEGLVEALDQPLLEQPAWLQRAVTILAQALLEPSCLCVDEPTYGLQEADADRLLQWLRRLAMRVKLLLVLHHQGQARAIADRIILLGGGRVLAHQPVADFFERPADPWVSHFLRTGGLPLPAPDARPADLDESAALPPPLPAQALQPAPARPAPQQAAPALQAPVAAPAAAPGAVAPSPARPVALPPPRLEGVEEASMVGKVILSEYRAPAGFHWILPGRLAACPQPGASAPLDYDLDLLANVGITWLVSLTEQDLDPDALHAHGLKNLHLPVKDGAAPTLNQAYMLLVRMQALMARGEVLAVHCAAGRGRTGAIVAAWLIRDGGLSARTALERLRRIDPAFVQTEAQEQFLEQMEADLLRRMA